MDARPVGLLFLAAALTCGCGDDDGEMFPDAGKLDAGMLDGGDGGAETCDEVPGPFETGSTTGDPAPLTVGAGQARAGRVTTADLPDHPRELVLWEEGDFVLANEYIAIVIEDAGPSDLFEPFGGKVIGLARMEGGRMVEPADLNELISGTGRFIVEAESVTVMNDGTDGGAAVVRAVGPLVSLPFAMEFSRAFAPEDLAHLRASVDYVLEPGARRLDVYYEYLNPVAFTDTVSFPVMLFFQKYRMPSFAPGVGYAVPTGVELPWIAFEEAGGTSYGWARPDLPSSLFIELSGAQVFRSPSFDIAGCTKTRVHWGRLYAGGPGIDGLWQAIAEDEGVALRAIAGTVVDGTGAPQSGVYVHATAPGEDDERAYVTRAVTNAAGEYALHVPADATVELTATRKGDVPVGPLEVAPATTEQDFTLGPAGTVRIVVTEDGAPVPARVQIIPTTPVPETLTSFGDPAEQGGRLHVAFPVDGDVTLRVPAGDHRIVVSRGYEYELVTRDVTVAAGASLTEAVAIERVVDTTDVLCGDFHIHTSRSPDAPDDAPYKVASAIADGLEIPVRSEHEFVADFEPVIAELGVEEFAYGPGSLELTTFAWGHFGVFPLEPRPELVNHGAFEWAGRQPPDVFAEVRGREQAAGPPALIINHPRNYGGTGPLDSLGAYFDMVDYDPATGMASRTEWWDEDFRLIEVFNDTDFDHNFDRDNGTVRDWFSFLNAGQPMFAIGSSDSHRIATSPVGYPRTCIELGFDDPAALRALGPATGPALIRDQLLAGAMTISGGVYLTVATAAGIGPGGTVTGASGREAVDVRVQAPTWVQVDRLRVYVDGALVEDIALDETTADPTNPVVRFDDRIEFDLTLGALPSWMVLVASGPETLEPVHPGRKPFAVSNPIFFAGP
jgi:hypothetical protein